MTRDKYTELDKIERFLEVYKVLRELSEDEWLSVGELEGTAGDYGIKHWDFYPYVNYSIRKGYVISTIEEEYDDVNGNKWDGKIKLTEQGKAFLKKMEKFVDEIENITHPFFGK
jgi:hypothetical protein